MTSDHQKNFREFSKSTIRIQDSGILVSAEEMRRIEEEAFVHDTSPDELMEWVGRELTREILLRFPRTTHLILASGKGNNAGDGFVVARHFLASGKKVSLLLSASSLPVFESSLTPLAKEKFQQIRDQVVVSTSSPDLLNLNFIADFSTTIALDTLVGTGARPPLHGDLAKTAQALSQLGEQTGIPVIAIDIPSGLDPESGEPTSPGIVADLTLTLGFPKSCLVKQPAINSVGQLACIPLPYLQSPPVTPQSRRISTPGNLRHLLPTRPPDSHKGNYGRIAIFAGAPGFFGAGALAASGALHAGGGLISLFVPPESYPAITACCPPEVMVSPLESATSILESNFDVLALGPGLGTRYEKLTLELIQNFPNPCVIDADALRILSMQEVPLGSLAANRVLTPHPGEMALLHPASKNMTREAVAAWFCETSVATLLLKGARTLIASRSTPLTYNPTGSPAMATGGMGDVLTGMIAAFLALPLSPPDAARLATYLAGSAAEIALRSPMHSPQSFTPSLLLKFFGPAFQSLLQPAFRN